MNSYLVLTIISDDKPGVVELLSQTINQHGGNWLESRMAHLAGKFAGILRVSVSSANQSALQDALAALAAKGIQVVSAAAAAKPAAADQRLYRFSLVGADRAGIIKEIAQAFSAHQISVDELDTHCSSMPWTGEPMFTASGLLVVPAHVDVDKLTDQLEAIGDELGVDIELESYAASADASA